MPKWRQKLVLRSATATTCALLTLVSFSWATNKAPKKFQSGLSHPHPTLARNAEGGHAHSSGPAPLPSRLQTAKQMELNRLEHQNATFLKSQSVQRNRPSGTAAHVRPESTTHSSGINFSYHPPRGQSTGTSGGHKH